MSDNTRAIIDRVTRWAAQQQLPAPAAVEVHPQGIVVIFTDADDASAWAWWLATESLHPEGDFDYADRGPRTGLPGLEIIHRPDNQR
jgi:hypothetical protein